MSGSDLYVSLKQGNLCDRTVEYLTSLILNNRLVPGEFLPSEPDLCKRLNISRATVREAVRILEARGLVERRRGVGILVSDRSYEVAVQSIGLLLQRSNAGVRDVMEVRLGFECQAAALAASRATDSEIMAMASEIEIMRSQSSTVDEYVTADLGFHLRLAQGSHNAVLIMLMNLVRELLLESIYATYALDGHTERRLQEHGRILDAIRRHDPEAAQAAMRDHLKATDEERLREMGLIHGRASREIQDDTNKQNLY